MCMIWAVKVWLCHIECDMVGVIIIAHSVMMIPLSPSISGMSLTISIHVSKHPKLGCYPCKMK